MPTATEEPRQPPGTAGSILDRLTGRWAILFVAAACCLAPLIVYNLDPFLRYRVGMLMYPGHRLAGVFSVLYTQASARPATLLALLAPAFALVYVIVARTVRGMRAAPRESRRKWLGGWLAIFTLREAISVVDSVRTLYASRDVIATNVLALPHLGQTRLPSLVLVTLAHFLLAVCFLVTAAYGIWLILRRHPRAPAYWTIACGAFAALIVFGRAIQVWERTLGARIEITDFPQIPLVEAVVVGVIVDLIWCAYWIRSRRVLETFGRRGLDLFAKPTASIGPPEQLVLEESPGLPSQT